MSDLAIIVNSLNRGGSERVAKILAEEMSEFSNITIITLNKNDSTAYRLQESVNRITLNETGKKSKIGLIRELRTLVKKERYKKVLVLGTPLLVIVFPALSLLDTKIIVSERNDPRYFKGKKTTKIVSKILINFVDFVIFQTEEIQDLYNRRVKRKSAILPNPIQFEFSDDSSIKTRKKNIINVGRLVPQKNQEMLIKAFQIVLKKYPDYRLLIYGEGPERGTLENLISLNNLEESVNLLGVVENVFEEHRDSMMFVLSSDFEGLPNALIEAIMSGIPSIATDCDSGGPRSILGKNENGILVPVGNEQRLAEAMIKIIENQDLRQKYSNRQKNIYYKYESQKVSKEWFRILSMV